MTRTVQLNCPIKAKIRAIDNQSDLTILFYLWVLLLTYMYKALNNFAPNYVSDLTDIYVPERNLRSAQSRQLIQPT